MCAFWGLGGGPLGAVLGRLGGLVGRLEPSWTVVGLPLVVSTLSWIILALCLSPSGPSWGSLEAPEAPGGALTSSSGDPPRKQTYPLLCCWFASWQRILPEG